MWYWRADGDLSSLLSFPTIARVICIMLDDTNFPTSPEALDAAFLSRILNRDVCDISCVPIGQDVGFTGGRLTRIRLSYGSDDTQGPTTVVAKFAPGDGALRRRFSASNQNEVAFYSRVARCDVLAAPQCFSASYDPRTDASLVVLEDLDLLPSRGFLPGGTTVEAEAVVDALATAHAAYWETPNTRQVNSEDCLLGFDLQFAFDAYPDKLRRLLPGFELPPDVQALLAFLSEAPGTLSALNKASPPTLVHGDVHLDNIAFRREGEAVLLDWQFAGTGCGAFDLSYFLASSLEPELRRSMEVPLLRRYHVRLISAGVQNYDFGALKHDYLRGIASKICMTVIATVKFENDSPQKIAWRTADLRRLLAFCKDHSITPDVLRPVQ